MTMTHRHHRIGGRRVAGAALAVGLLAAGCSSADDADQSTTPTTTITTPTTTITTTIAGDAGTSVSVDDDGVTTVDGDALDDELAEIPADDLSGDLSGDLSDALSDADRANLIFMREEEKLALDVYDALYDIWGLRIFDNIARAEQTHTDSVKTLLDRWELPDPAADRTAGVFQNGEIQTLYDDLVERGSESLVEALLVGALIEDLDIADLQARESDDPGIALVFANLEKGSRNHMRAFVGQLESRGATYTPEFISQDDFDAIVDSPTERGRAG